MATVGELVSILTNEIHIPDPTGARRAIVRALSFLRQYKFICSESTASFSLKLNQTTYGTDDGVPGDILSVIGVPVIERSSGQLYPMDKQITLEEMRELQSNVNIRGYPRKWVRFNQKFIFFPEPSFAYDVQVDYWSDCTRDEKTGVRVEDVTAHEDFSNQLLSEAEELVLSRSAYAYFLGKGSGAAQAQQWKTLYNEAWGSAMGVRDADKMSGKQAKWHL